MVEIQLGQIFFCCEIDFTLPMYSIRLVQVFKPLQYLPCVSADQSFINCAIHQLEVFDDGLKRILHQL